VELARPNRPLARTVPQVLPSVNDLSIAGAPRPALSAEPSSPSVHIGVVEITVAAPADPKPARAAAPAQPANLASRRYLRKL
jgi:hypothetical protein